MTRLRQILWIPFLLLLALSGANVLAADQDDDAWAPTPPRLSFIDGDVSYWRQGAEDWVNARRNLALAEGDALYAGRGANFEVQFDNRSFVRADQNSQLALLNNEDHAIQFKVTDGLVSFDIRNMSVGDRVEISTPDAVFTIEHPGYYRVEVGNRDTHFITRRGGRANVMTADGRSLSIYPSEDIVVTGGNPVQVATYAAPPADAWDRWNDARSDRVGESVSARYLPPDVYGAEELDYYGSWRVVPDYGSVWIPRGVAPDWAPYSTGSWVWDPFYEWTWVDDAPWGWAPFHYGRWVYVDGFWAWAPGPVVRRSVYSPALVAFMIHDHDVSVQIGIGLPGLWWVALGWGEPVLPWWGHREHRWHPRWDGWGGPRIDHDGHGHYDNAHHPHAILTMPADKFGRTPVRATAETRYRPESFVPLRDAMPKPSPASLLGGAPRGVQPPREMVNRPVVSTRPPRENVLPWQDKPTGAKTGATPLRYVKPLTRQEEGRPGVQRPPIGTEGGPEREPAPLPPRLKEFVAPPTPPGRVQSQVRPEVFRRDQEVMRKETPVVRPSGPAMSSPQQGAVNRPAPPVPRENAQNPRAPERVAPPPRVEAEQTRKTQQPLPGKPANQTYQGQGRESRGWDERGGGR